jgi:pyrroloquinoline quinone biosynthesis protein B
MAEIVILGSAQDGGVPHAGCLCPNCRAARLDHSRRRLPASLGIRSGDDWAMIDATSAFEEQLHALWSRRPSSKDHAAERYRPPETLLLTHAHTGHYSGLWQLDRSVLSARGVRVLAPPRTAGFLRRQEPWAAMIDEGFIQIEALAWDEEFELYAGVRVTAFEVPHRAGPAAAGAPPTDTAAFLIRGPSGSALYLPDIDSWEDWERDVVEVVGGVNVAILDGTFWASPTSARVPHPPIVETMERLQVLVDGGARIVFTHLNHSNPVLIDGGAEAMHVAANGFEVAREGMSVAI